MQSGQIETETIRIHNPLDWFANKGSNNNGDLYDSTDIAKKSSEIYSRKVGNPAGPESNHLEASHEVNTFYTAKKLAGFVPENDDKVYETKVVKARVDGEETDFYEVHWADLSRVTNSFLQLLTSFYRLIFVLCRLSDNVKDFGRYNFDQLGSKTGSIFRGLTYACMFLLATLIPALNLGLFAAFVTIVPYSFGLDPNGPAQAVFSAAVCTAFLALAYLSFHQLQKQKNESSW